jgi:hypothetical protein
MNKLIKTWEGCFGYFSGNLLLRSEGFLGIGHAILLVYIIGSVDFDSAAIIRRVVQVESIKREGKRCEHNEEYANELDDILGE